MSKKRTKQYLMLLMVIGLVSIAAGGSGTFASFSAETTNAGNYFATGSLFLHNTHGATTCTSESASTNLNDGTNGDTCSTLFTANFDSNAATYATLTLKNAGTVDANGIKFKLASACTSAIAYQANTTLSGAVTANVTTAIPVNATTVFVRNGKHILLTDGTNSDELVVTGGAVPLGYSGIVNVTTAPTHSYLSGDSVESSAEFGTPSLCAALKFVVDETTNGSFLHGIGDGAACAYPAAAEAGDGTGCDFTDGSVQTLDNVPTSDTALTLGDGATFGTGNTAAALNAGGTRYLVVGIKPDTSVLAGNSNTYQLRKAKFDLVWHIDQS